MIQQAHRYASLGGGKEALNAIGLGPIRVAFRICLLAIGLAASFAAGAAVASALVQFPNLPGREPAHIARRPAPAITRAWLAGHFGGVSDNIRSARNDRVRLGRGLQAGGEGMLFMETRG